VHKNVEIVIGRLATDPGLQDRFARDPRRVLRELSLELSEVEIAALVATDPRTLRTFTAELDARICKALPAVASQSTLNETRAESECDSRKETK
jgi:hypothetical protein